MPIIIENIDRYIITFKNGNLIISDIIIKRDIDEMKKKENIGIEIKKSI
jgi:hypothetical protein